MECDVTLSTCGKHIESRKLSRLLPIPNIRGNHLIACWGKPIRELYVILLGHSIKFSYFLAKIWLVMFRLRKKRLTVSDLVEKSHTVISRPNSLVTWQTSLIWSAMSMCLVLENHTMSSPLTLALCQELHLHPGSHQPALHPLRESCILIRPKVYFHDMCRCSKVYLISSGPSQKKSKVMSQPSDTESANNGMLLCTVNIRRN